MDRVACGKKRACGVVRDGRLVMQWRLFLLSSLSRSPSLDAVSQAPHLLHGRMFLAFSARGRVVPMDPVDGGSIAPKRCAWFGSYVQIGGRRRLFRPFACHTSSWSMWHQGETQAARCVHRRRGYCTRQAHHHTGDKPAPHTAHGPCCICLLFCSYSCNKMRDEREQRMWPWQTLNRIICLIKVENRKLFETNACT